VLLLPALSSISTRRELHPLMRGLAARFHLIAPDWPGFGDQPRPPIAWTPEALSAFLDWFVREQVPALHATIAAGHAASYALATGFPAPWRPRSARPARADMAGAAADDGRRR
jgi:pimeloyl-ACP methyl ester carboxylesterase